MNTVHFTPEAVQHIPTYHLIVPHIPVEMAFTPKMALFYLFGSSSAFTHSTFPALPVEAGCGELNVFYTYVLRPYSSG